MATELEATPMGPLDWADDAQRIRYRMLLLHLVLQTPSLA
jgi:hypothetical protein